MAHVYALQAARPNFLKTVSVSLIATTRNADTTWEIVHQTRPNVLQDVSGPW